jgi:hypothetical protein
VGPAGLLRSFPTILTYRHDSAYNLPKSFKLPAVNPHSGCCLARAPFGFRRVRTAETEGAFDNSADSQASFRVPWKSWHECRAMPQSGAEIGKVAYVRIVLQWRR